MKNFRPAVSVKFNQFSVLDVSLKKLTWARPCLCVCVFVCLFLASDHSETIEVIITKLCTVAASDMRMHHVFFLLTLTFIRGRTDLNHENNKCSIISENVQAMPITFAVRVARLFWFFWFLCVF